MKNWKHPPLDPNVAQYVDSYWFLEKSDADSSHAHPRLNPYPEAHLILTPFDQPHQYTLNEVGISGYGTHLLLPSTRTVQLHHADPFVIVGIKFKVGALYSLTQTPDQPQLNTIIGNPAFLPPLDPALINLASNTAAPDGIPAFCAQLDGWLRPWLAEAHEDKYSKQTRMALSLLENTQIADLSIQLHCSRRTIERSFLRVTGLTLKQYHSMLTLDRLLIYLHQHNESQPDWADIAAKFGFSDQPHLVRYFKTAIRGTPGSYLKQRDLTIDVYGDFE